MRITPIVALLMLQVIIAYPQIQPIPGAELNYNQIMFEHPAVMGASAYIIQITTDTFNHAFRHPVVEVADSFSAILVSQLQFGKSYLWRYCALVKGKRSAWSSTYNFTILPHPIITNADLHLRVLQNDSSKNAGGLVIIDGLHAIYDRNGNLVWFFPSFNAGYKAETGTDDLRVTKAGTITTLGGQNGMELDLVGKRLWFTPYKMKIKSLAAFGPFYNHALERLNNGHYLVIGLDYDWKKLPKYYDLSKIIGRADTVNNPPSSLNEGQRAVASTGGYLLRIDNDANYVLMNTAAVFEYDKKDSVVWSWKAASYLKEEDIFPTGQELDSSLTQQEPHLNAISADEKNEYVYASFRNLNRIIKIEKSTGQVVYSWGTKMASGEAVDGDGFFHKQHGSAIMNDGNIVVFNDADMRSKNEPSSVEIFSQPNSTSHSKITWKYDCLFDSAMVKNKSSRGGNADVLPNNNLLVCMGSVPRLFEVTRDKKIVWSAVVEKDSAEAEKMEHALYRIHYASSLYPCYYTVQVNHDTLTSNDSRLKLEIRNAGTESDLYTITVSSSYNNYKQKINSVIVNKRQTAFFEIKPIAQPAHNEKIEVVITSVNNPDNIRSLSVVYK